MRSNQLSRLAQRIGLTDGDDRRTAPQGSLSFEFDAGGGNRIAP
jgi:hypothetical protein